MANLQKVRKCYSETSERIIENLAKIRSNSTQIKLRNLTMQQNMRLMIKKPT